MFEVQSTATAIFLILFGVGFGFAALSFLLGVGHAGGGLHVHHGSTAGHVAGGGHGAHLPGIHAHPHGPHVHVDNNTIAPLNGFTVAAFLMWFGGVGFLLAETENWAMPLVAGAAAAAGFAGAAVVFLFLVKVLLPGQTYMNEEDYRREGTIARVTVGIPANGVGEVVYTMAGARHSDAARSVQSDRPSIPRGEEVVITGFERGVALVQSVRALLEGEPEAPAKLPAE